MGHRCACHMRLPLQDKWDGSFTHVAVRIMNPLTPPLSAYEPYGPNGVRQMGGDHDGVHEDSLIGRTCVCCFVWYFQIRRLRVGLVLNIPLSVSNYFLKLIFNTWPLYISQQLDQDCPMLVPERLGRLCHGLCASLLFPDIVLPC